MATPDYELHTLAGPYAMDAVTAAEGASFAAHLGDCEQCREDVREMREATARLGLAAAVRPRPELREQTIRAAYRTSQLGPFAANEVEPRGEATVASLAAATRRSRSGRRLALRLPGAAVLAVAAVLVVVAAVLGGMTNSAMEQLHHSQQREHMIAAVLNAPDAVMLTARISTGGNATVVMSHRERAAVLTAHGLAALPSTEAYEIWLMGPTGPRSAGMLKPLAGGMAGPAIVIGLRSGDMIALTIEPASGSRTPTSVLVVVFRARH
jgi:hypothetical protein